MAEFKLALPTVFLHEGRFANDRNDPGGATNFGISLRFLLTVGDLNKDGWPDGDLNRDGVINVEDIREMTEEKAAYLYQVCFWIPQNYEKIADQDMATKVFDLAVNMGSRAANKCIQRAVRAAIGLKVVDDGDMGLKSITAINMANPKILLAALKSEAAGYYRSIKFKGSERFINGWLRRAYDNPVKENESEQTLK